MQRIGVEERRARLARRHRLAAEARAASPLEVARSLVALHSTDPSTVFLSIWARTLDFAPADLEEALYDERTLVRMLGMRRTLWVVPRELVRSSTPPARERRRARAQRLEGSSRRAA